jgi:hypothetical protein
MDEEEGFEVGTQDGLKDWTVDWDGGYVRRRCGLLIRLFRLFGRTGLRSRVASVGTYHVTNKTRANVAANTILMFETLFLSLR